MALSAAVGPGTAPSTQSRVRPKMAATALTVVTVIRCGNVALVYPLMLWLISLTQYFHN